VSSAFPYWDSLVNIGKCVKPHGLKGEIGVKAITDFPERFEQTEVVFAHQRKDPVKRLEIEAVRDHSGGFLLKFKGIASIAQAEKLRGFFLAVPEDELVILEEDEYWHWELEGLNAFDPEGNRVGVLTEVIESAAHDLYLIKKESGEECLVPAVHQYVPEIDIPQKRIVVVIPEIED